MCMIPQFRLGKAAYGMRQWEGAIAYFEQLRQEFPSNGQAPKELDRTAQRRKESLDGEYDLRRLYDESRQGKHFFDLADYTGPVRVADIPGKGLFFYIFQYFYF